MTQSSLHLHIPGYTLLRRLGRGGMATVYLALQQSFDREVALKVMAPSLAQQERFSERFLREARIISRLQHPNIVTVYDVGVYQQHHYLSMEYIPGDDLKSRLGSLNAEQTLQVIRELSVALDYAGRKGYIHRDVKPDNIRLHSEYGRTVLADFGIAKTADSLCEERGTGKTLGTPHYMSPEQVRGQILDHRSDLYSLGILTYLLLTGELPYNGPNSEQIVRKHLQEPIPHLQDELVWFQPILNKLLAKRPEQRFQSAGELYFALQRVPEEVMVELDRLLLGRGEVIAALTSTQAIPTQL